MPRSSSTTVVAGSNALLAVLALHAVFYSFGDTTGTVLGQGYDVFYACPVEKTSRSKMNVSFTFRGGDEALEKKFFLSRPSG